MRVIDSSLLTFMLCALFAFVGPAVQGAAQDAEQDAAARIQRQLELAEELRAKRLEKQQQKEEVLKNELQSEKRCNRLKDEMRRFGERRRWYRLNEDGERVYLTDTEVKSKRRSLDEQYRESCGD